MTNCAPGAQASAATARAMASFFGFGPPAQPVEAAGSQLGLASFIGGDGEDTSIFVGLSCRTCPPRSLRRTSQR